MITSKHFRIASIIVGALFLLFTIYLGYGAYTTKEYSKFFIILIMFSISMTFINLGTKGKKEAWKVGKKLIGTGLGLILIAVLISNLSQSTDIKKEMSDAMIDTVAEATAADVKRQLQEENFVLPEDKEKVRRSCQALPPETDERKFSMNDICKELEKEENKDLNISQIIEKALITKTKELATQDVQGEIDDTKSFDTTFGSISNTKNYILVFGIAGAALFTIGIISMFYSREQDKTLTDVILQGSISATIACAINAAIFKIIELLIKTQLAEGKLVSNTIIQKMIPGLSTAGMQQEVTKKLLMKVGEIMYDWLGPALNTAFKISIILLIIFITAAATTYFIKKSRG